MVLTIIIVIIDNHTVLDVITFLVGIGKLTVFV